jgi:hypothetical protein
MEIDSPKCKPIQKEVSGSYVYNFLLAITRDKSKYIEQVWSDSSLSEKIRNHFFFKAQCSWTIISIYSDESAPCFIVMGERAFYGN